MSAPPSGSDGGRAAWYERSVVVTGANGLLTSAVARQLAILGAPLLLHVHRETSRIDSTCELARADRIAADLSTTEGRELVIRRAAALAPLGALVLGASRFTRTPVEQLDHATVRSVLGLELESHLEIVGGLARHLAAGARVVLFTDTATTIGWADYPVYLAAKGGLDAAVRSLARSLGPRVSVLGVAPGSLDGTPAPPDGDPRETTALGRRGTAAEVAAATVGLMRLPQAVIHGVTVPVDGGRRLLFGQLPSD